MTHIQEKAAALLEHLEETKLTEGAETSYRVCFKTECVIADQRGGAGHDAHNHDLLYDCIVSVKDTLSQDCAYSWTYDLLKFFIDNDIEDLESDRCDDLMREWADDVPVYTHDQTAWLASDIRHVAYLEQAIKNGTEASYVLPTVICLAREELYPAVLAAVREARA